MVRMYRVNISSISVTKIYMSLNTFVKFMYVPVPRIKPRSSVLLGEYDTHLASEPTVKYGV